MVNKAFLRLYLKLLKWLRTLNLDTADQIAVEREISAVLIKLASS
jgi:hypothetical protein